MEYKGSCHCGKITFIAQGELTEALSCNCSICQKKRLFALVFTEKRSRNYC